MTDAPPWEAYLPAEPPIAEALARPTKRPKLYFDYGRRLTEDENGLETRLENKAVLLALFVRMRMRGKRSLVARDLEEMSGSPWYPEAELILAGIRRAVERTPRKGTRTSDQVCFRKNMVWPLQGLLKQTAERAGLGNKEILISGGGKPAPYHLNEELSREEFHSSIEEAEKLAKDLSQKLKLLSQKAEEQKGDFRTECREMVEKIRELDREFDQRRLSELEGHLDLK